MLLSKHYCLWQLTHCVGLYTRGTSPDTPINTVLLFSVLTFFRPLQLKTASASPVGLGGAELKEGHSALLWYQVKPHGFEMLCTIVT